MTLSLTKATAMLQGLGITVPPARPVTPTTYHFPDLEQQHRERVAQKKREHAERVGKLKSDTDQRIARQQQHEDLLLEENKLHKELLREESIVRRQEKDRGELASRRSSRHFKEELGLPLNLHDYQQLVDEWLAVPTPDDPIVRILAPWLAETATLGKIDVRPCADVALSNGSAVRKLRYVEVGKRDTVRACLIEAHEQAHVLHEELADSRDVPGEFGTKISVPSEIAAWRWVLDHIPAWTPEMHSDMCRFIGSYKSFATDAEKVEIDAICSDLNYRRVQLRIAVA